MFTSAAPTSTVPRLSYGPSAGVGLGLGRSESVFDRAPIHLNPYAGSSNFSDVRAPSNYDRDIVRTPRQERSIAGGSTTGGGSVRAADDDDEADLEMPPYPDDDAPIVPVELMRSQVKPIQWDRHPCSPIILLLLNNRGAFLPQHKDLVEYHMAEQFLEALSLLQYGAFFIKYAAKRSTPKERYFMIRVLPDADEKPTPFLTWQLHQNSFQLIDRVPLADLVGITCNAQSLAFRRYLVTPDLIRGCHAGTRVAKISTKGCFSLWFYDRKKGVARSLDLLSCSEAVFSLWTTTFTAILAVNSSTVGSSAAAAVDPRQELRELLLQSQQGVMGQAHRDADDDENAGDDDGVAGFVEE